MVSYSAIKQNHTRGAVKELLIKFDVTKSVLSRLWDRYRTESDKDDPPANVRKRGSGAQLKIGEELGAELVNFARTNLYQFSFEDAASFIGVSESTVRRYFHRVGWRGVRRTVCPMLSPDHMGRRLQWAKDHRRCTFTMQVSIDKKWLYTVQLGAKLKVPQGDETSRTYTHSTSSPHPQTDGARRHCHS